MLHTSVVVGLFIVAHGSLAPSSKIPNFNVQKIPGKVANENPYKIPRSALSGVPPGLGDGISLPRPARSSLMSEILPASAECGALIFVVPVVIIIVGFYLAQKRSSSAWASMESMDINGTQVIMLSPGDSQQDSGNSKYYAGIMQSIRRPFGHCFGRQEASQATEIQCFLDESML